MEKEVVKKELDLILTQNDPESRRIMMEALNGNYDLKHCVEYLLYYTDRPDKQRRVLKYSKTPDILYEEFFMVSMLAIEDSFVEEKMVECFKNHLINKVDDFLNYRYDYQMLSNSNNEQAYTLALK